MAATRGATLASAAVAVVVAGSYLLLTWDAWLTNFQVRWMCEEDRPFVLLRRGGVSALGIPEYLARRDPKAVAAFAPNYPEVVVPADGARVRPRYELAERWPTVLRDYWGFRVVRTDFAILDLADRNRVLANTSLFVREARPSAGLRELRSALSPPPERCAPSDRVEFVKGVLSPGE